jgi:AmmeMemoRadiSam system protein B
MVHANTLPMRKAWYAGSWYAADRQTLLEQITQTVRELEVSEQKGPIRFAVLPHAGLTYSARGIAPVVVHAPKHVERVMILSPSHYTVVPDNVLSFGYFSGYETPLGSLSSFSTTLESQGPDASIAIQREHAVEMVLPFLAYLQHVQQSPIKVAMALISHLTDSSHASLLAENLIAALGEQELESGNTLVIASSDFTHYGKRFGYAPFGAQVDNSVADKVRQNDLAIAQHLALGEIGPLFLAQRMQRTTICGIAGATIVSAMARQLNASGWVANYYTSRDVLKEMATDFVAYATVLWR